MSVLGERPKHEYARYPMSHTFSETFRARWVDMDFNQHMRNAAFLGCAEDTRMRFLDSHGWTMDRFRGAGLGPVVVEDLLQYRKELRLLETFHVSLLLAGASADARKLRLRSEFRRESDGAFCGSVESVVLWLDLAARKPIAPPADLRDIWLALSRSEAFVEL